MYWYLYFEISVMVKVTMYLCAFSHKSKCYMTHKI